MGLLFQAWVELSKEDLALCFLNINASLPYPLTSYSKTFIFSFIFKYLWLNFNIRSANVLNPPPKLYVIGVKFWMDAHLRTCFGICIMGQQKYFLGILGFCYAPQNRGRGDILKYLFNPIMIPLIWKDIKIQIHWYHKKLHCSC